MRTNTNTMKSTTNFRRGARRVILPEFVGPMIIIFLSGLFVSIWGILYNTTKEEILNSLNLSEAHVILPATISGFSLVDFLLAFILLIGVQQFNDTTCIVWIILQLLLFMIFSLTLFLCPFISLNIIVTNSCILGWTIGGLILFFIYKLYRFRIIYILVDEIHNEMQIWEGRTKVYSLYNYE